VKMKKHFCAFLCLCPLVIMAQDSLHTIKKNQIALEVFGNNFFDINSSFQPGYFSLNYDRKFIAKRSCFIVSIGTGYMRTKGYYHVKDKIKLLTIVDFSGGFLWRPNYKRNGFWFGVFCSNCFGKIYYLDEKDNNHLHNASFQISPNLTYQFQSKSEHFFVRLSLTPKILASAFTSTYEYGYGVKLFPFWGGISIGGAW